MMGTWGPDAWRRSATPAAVDRLLDAASARGYTGLRCRDREDIALEITLLTEQGDGPQHAFGPFATLDDIEEWITAQPEVRG